ncbi:hypothetical protein D3C71_1355050 [compost metagenome]
MHVPDHGDDSGSGMDFVLAVSTVPDAFLRSRIGYDDITGMLQVIGGWRQSCQREYFFQLLLRNGDAFHEIHGGAAGLDDIQERVGGLRVH